MGTLLIWDIERRSRLAVETVIGVVFSTALALGSMMTSGDELIHALLGRSSELTSSEALIALGAAVAVLVFFAIRRREIVVSSVSRDIAASLGIRMRWLDLQFLLAFAATVGLGLRYLGVLLMGSLVIIPAAAAKRVASSLRGMLVVAISVALLSTLAGTWIGTRLGSETGPPIVLVAGGCFRSLSSRGGQTDCVRDKFGPTAVTFLLRPIGDFIQGTGPGQSGCGAGSAQDTGATARLAGAAFLHVSRWDPHPGGPRCRCLSRSLIFMRLRRSDSTLSSASERPSWSSSIHASRAATSDRASRPASSAREGRALPGAHRGLGSGQDARRLR